jgi:hypothetical protein
MATPSEAHDARFALDAWPGEPRSSTVAAQPFHLGSTVFPTPLSGFSPQPTLVWNSLGFVA